MKITQITGDWPVVMVRCTAPGFDNDFSLDATLYVGSFSYIKGKIIPLDEGVYKKTDEYQCGRLTKDKNGNNILVLIYRAEWGED